jgi:hypothetical protein
MGKCHIQEETVKTKIANIESAAIIANTLNTNTNFYCTAQARASFVVKADVKQNTEEELCHKPPRPQ